MILYESQYETLKDKLKEMNASIAKFEELVDSETDQFTLQGIDAMKGFAANMQRDVDEYLLLQSGNFIPPKLFSLGELPKILIQTRIARGMSQRDLADALEMDYVRIKRYEEEEYFGASFSKLLEVANLMEIETSQSLSNWADDNDIGTIWKSSDDFNWDEFPIDEAATRGWIENKNEKISADIFRAWFKKAAGPYATFAFHRRMKLSNDKSAREVSCQSSLFAWQARVKQLAEEEIGKSPVNEFQLNERWLKELVQLTVYDDGPVRAIELLRQNGIILVFERHLPKTYLDGAAMLSHEGIPIVALTLRYDRLDYFWFTLFHELGHVYCHLFDNEILNFSFFDEKPPTGSCDGGESNLFLGDEREKQANNFAFDKLISPETWDTCLSRFAISDEAVSSDAERIGIHPSIIAGRIRNTLNNYSLLSNLVGQGHLHRLFENHLK